MMVSSSGYCVWVSSVFFFIGWGTLWLGVLCEVFSKLQQPYHCLCWLGQACQGTYDYHLCMSDSQCHNWRIFYFILLLSFFFSFQSLLLNVWIVQVNAITLGFTTVEGVEIGTLAMTSIVLNRVTKISFLSLLHQRCGIWQIVVSRPTTLATKDI